MSKSAQHRIEAVLEANKRVIEAAVAFCASSQETPEADMEGATYIETRKRGTYRKLRREVAALQELIGASSTTARPKAKRAA